MQSSRTTIERYFDAPVRRFGPPGLQAGLSRLKAVAIVAGVFAGGPAATIHAASAAEAYPDSRPQAVAQVQAPAQAARKGEAGPSVRTGLAQADLGRRDQPGARRGAAVPAGAGIRDDGARFADLPAQGAPRLGRAADYGDQFLPADPYASRTLAYGEAGYAPPEPFAAAARSRNPDSAGSVFLASTGDYVFRPDLRSESIQVGRDVVENVFAASQLVGIDPAFVMALSWRSSAAAENGALPTTGMKVDGMFAYGEQRFLEEVSRWGSSLGMQDVVDGIRRTPQGQLVAVGHARYAVDGLRRDIHASAVLGAANAKSARAFLVQSGLDRTNAADVLVAIQFGSDVALNLVRARMTNPHQPMAGPLADVVAGMGLPPADPAGRAWTVASFNEATDFHLRAEMRAFAPMRGMTLAEQHRPASAQDASYSPGPR
jgi:hypothetical protein